MDNRVSIFQIKSNRKIKIFFSRIIEMVLHIVVVIEIIIIIINNVHIIIPLGIRNSNVNHNCSILSYFLPKHTFIDFFLLFVLHFQTFFSVFLSLFNKPVHNITSFQTKTRFFLLVFDVYFSLSLFL